MKLSRNHQRTVSQNSEDKFKAYGLTLSEEEWKNTETFEIRLKDLASAKLDSTKLRTGNIIGFKEFSTNRESVDIRTYRVEVNTNPTVTKINLIPNGQTKKIKRFNAGDSSLGLFSIIRDHTIATKLGNPTVTLPTIL